MKNIRYILAIAVVAILFSSCKDVVTVELKSADEKYVIEANLNNQLGSAKVAIAQTKNANTTSGFNGESGAVVTITDDKGKESRLTESSTKGIYTDPFLKGTPGTAYTLKIEINGQTFTSTSKMPAIVKLEAAYAIEASAIDGKRKFATVKFTDPAGKGNAYRFIEYRNGVYNKVISVLNDDLIDGNVINQVLLPKELTEATKYVSGDKIKVEFLTIDNPVYKYWYSTNKGIQSLGENTTPINPVSNISGGAIGYFSAHTLQSREFTIK
ncbi:DUF4249 domain-containing protein [Pedobacter sp. UC225_65]|uniref:DUF4249 domain-containing protein n=1 Tax=Pedobacter sp. UC225_65 TaxID=3350173 RepID=UPI00366CCF5B